MKHLIVFILVAFAANAAIGQPATKIAVATQQHIIGADLGNGWEMEYLFEIAFLDKNIADTTIKIKIDSLWVNGYRLKLEETPPDLIDAAGNDEVLKTIPFTGKYEAEEIHRAPENQLGAFELKKVSPPTAYKGKTVLSYYYNKKRYFAVVEKFEHLPDAIIK